MNWLLIGAALLSLGLCAGLSSIWHTWRAAQKWRAVRNTLEGRENGKA